MEQQQIRVSFSVGTKLLLSLVLLLIGIIAFLDVSTILLVTEDKKAYTYQTQSTEAVMAGREFVNRAKHALDTLRISLVSVNPLQPIIEKDINSLKTILTNQSEVASILVALVKPDTAEYKVLTQQSKDTMLKSLLVEESVLSIPQELLKGAMPMILKNGYGFFNLSKPGLPPLVGVLFADLNLKSNPSGIPVAVGLISLGDIGSELRSGDLTIADFDGWVLFDTDPAAYYSRKNIADDPLFSTALQSKLAAGAREYTFNELKYMGSYVRPQLDVIVLTRTEWRKAMRATYALAERYILLGVMATAAAIIFALIFAKKLTAPLNRLYQATKEVAEGNFNINLDMSGRDEIAALSGSFNAMSKKISKLIDESVRAAHLENELAITSTIQQNLIPPVKYETEDVYIHSHYQAAAECGGDWWGFFNVGNKLCIMIADATGHGLPSALITASARSCFSVLHKLAQEDTEFTYSPGAMLAYANRVVFEAANGKIMMTFFTCMLDLEEGKLTYASAGHNPPWLFKKSEDKFTLKSLTADGTRLGESLDVAPFKEVTVDIAEGDILFMYTDGLMEGKNLAGDMYAKKRTRKRVEASLAGGPEKVITELMEEFLAFNGEKTLDDDVTLAVTRILKTGRPAST